MRSRNIKPGLYQNEDLAECSVWARYIFPGLWMMADREGRLEYRPKKIKGELLRFDEQAAEPLLAELQRWGFIEIYEVEGRAYIQILTFSKHQNPHHREAESDLPPPKSPGLSPHGTRTKPGATDSSDGDEAQGKPEASPGIKPEDATCEGGQAGLIPDSGFLIPDSLIPKEASVVGIAPEGEKTPNVASPVSRSIEIAVYLRQRGIVGSNSANPNIAAWGDDVRVTNEILDAALSILASRKLDKPAGPNYLATIIPDLLNPKPAQTATPRDDWYRSNPGIERKASELGINCPAGKNHDWLRERCEAELRKRAQGAAA